MKEVTKNNVKEGEFFKLKGDSRSYAYQADELWPGIMYCRCGENGIIGKPYSEWERVEDTANVKKVVTTQWFEDNRSASL